MVFDKTGTLTEDGMEILGVRATTGSTRDQTNPNFTDFAPTIKDLVVPEKSHENDLRPNILNEAMGCCHSLTFVAHELVGDPLELEMFRNTDWLLEEENNQNSMIGGESIVLATLKRKPLGLSIQSESDLPAHLMVIKRFDFESKLQRMCVITKHMRN
jgi:cation-transporting P-type ATPase 13A2